MKETKLMQKSNDKKTENEQSDSGDDLEYGPGIVSRLKTKYLSLTTKKYSNRPVRPSLTYLTFRRASSLENILADDEPTEKITYTLNCAKEFDPPKSADSDETNKKINRESRNKTKQQSSKRTRSLECGFRSFNEVVIEESLESKINEEISVPKTEFPPRDVVKSTVKLFETPKKSLEIVSPKQLQDSKTIASQPKVVGLYSNEKPIVSPKPVVITKCYKNPKTDKNFNISQRFNSKDKINTNSVLIPKTINNISNSVKNVSDSKTILPKSSAVIDSIDLIKEDISRIDFTVNGKVSVDQSVKTNGSETGKNQLRCTEKLETKSVSKDAMDNIRKSGTTVEFNFPLAESKSYLPQDKSNNCNLRQVGVIKPFPSPTKNIKINNSDEINKKTGIKDEEWTKNKVEVVERFSEKDRSRFLESSLHELDVSLTSTTICEKDLLEEWTKLKVKDTESLIESDTSKTMSIHSIKIKDIVNEFSDERRIVFERLAKLKVENPDRFTVVINKLISSFSPLSVIDMSLFPTEEESQKIEICTDVKIDKEPSEKYIPDDEVKVRQSENCFKKAQRLFSESNEKVLPVLESKQAVKEIQVQKSTLTPLQTLLETKRLIEKRRRMEVETPPVYNIKPWPQKENTMVFNFSNRKDVPDYIENDGLCLKNRSERTKNPSEQTQYLYDFCDPAESTTDDQIIEFEGANVVTKSNLQKSKKSCKKLSIHFDLKDYCYVYPAEYSKGESQDPSEIDSNSKDCSKNDKKINDNKEPSFKPQMREILYSTSFSSEYNNEPNSTEVKKDFSLYTPSKVNTSTIEFGMKPLTIPHFKPSPINDNSESSSDLNEREELNDSSKYSTNNLSGLLY